MIDEIKHLHINSRALQIAMHNELGISTFSTEGIHRNG